MFFRGISNLAGHSPEAGTPAARIATAGMTGIHCAFDYLSFWRR
jgi:hypothetical protein